MTKRVLMSAIAGVIEKGWIEGVEGEATHTTIKMSIKTAADRRRSALGIMQGQQ